MEPAESLAILWEDAHLIAVDKPAGVLSQGTVGGEPTLEGAVRRHLSAGVGGADVYLGTVHRLDRPVSGVIVWAKTPKATRRVAEAFARREVTKEYLAAVEGSGPVPDRWDNWLGPVDEAGVARVVAEGSPGAKRAITRARPIGGRVPPGVVLLSLAPETGRTHQLRAQAAARGRPVVGDARYGSARAFPSGIALHAARLAFEHPTTRRELVLVAGPPASWREAGIVPDLGR